MDIREVNYLDKMIIRSVKILVEFNNKTLEERREFARLGLETRCERRSGRWSTQIAGSRIIHETTLDLELPLRYRLVVVVTLASLTTRIKLTSYEHA